MVREDGKIMYGGSVGGGIDCNFETLDIQINFFRAWKSLGQLPGFGFSRPYPHFS